jgi:hypothetical protein
MSSKIIHLKSNIATLDVCDIFTVPPTQISIDKSIETTQDPIAPLSSGGPITFEFTTLYDEYLRLDESYLYIKYTVKAGLTTPQKAAKWEQVKPVNYLLHSMFKNVSLHINDVLVTQSVELYPFRAYLDAFLGYSDVAKSTHLSLAGWKKNAADLTFKPADLSSDKDTPSAQFEMLGRLHLDLTMCPKAIVPYTKITLRLYPALPEFYMKKTAAANETPKIIIDKAEFRAHRSKATYTLLDGHNKALKEGPAVYPLTRIEVKTASLPPGLIDYGIDNIHTGVLPSRVFAALIKNSAFNGDFMEDPFNFQPFNLSSIALTVGGELYPPQGYDGPTHKSYLALLQTLNQSGHNTDLNYTFEDFKAKPIYAINLNPDSTSPSGATSHVDSKRVGDLGVRLKFKSKNQSNDQALTLILWFEFENILTIDRDRIVRLGWAA